LEEKNLATDNAFLPRDKNELLDRIQGEWTALVSLVETLQEEQITRRDSGGWSIKDNLAHLTEWEQFLIRNQFEGLAAHEALGIDQSILENLDEAGINAVLLERNRDRPLSDVMVGLYKTHKRLLGVLRKLPEGDLQKSSRTIGSKTEPKLQWVIDNTYEHYLEHRLTIQATLV
jgi:hypothetical protein